MTKLSHIKPSGEANMVDISSKEIQKRTAIAKGKIWLLPNTLTLIAENGLKKGDVLATARIAAIQAAKQTSNLIPLCHTLLLSKVDIETNCQSDGIEVVAKVVCTGQTGVEMEALTAVSIALLTIYDMCKAVDKEMKIGDIALINKIKEDI